jgi:Ca2+-binding EF-hand superfamily protein
MGLRSQKADLKTLKDAFNQIDTDHDGCLSKEEIQKAGALLGNTFNNDGNWESIISKCDLDGDGKIDF